jgi:hypothetical protein
MIGATGTYGTNEWRQLQFNGGPMAMHPNGDAP